ncbi:hypothetical protein KEM56_000673, partial [Ascosphaera pollenicola]
MLDFMDYIQLAFADACGWKRNNSYSSLTDTAKAILDFPIPLRFKVNISSLSTPQFATAYTLGTVGLIDGSISYLFTSLPLHDTPSRSTLIPLRGLVPGYKQVYPADFETLPDDGDPTASTANKLYQALSGTSSRQDDPSSAAHSPSPTLLYASLHLPAPTTLTALFLRHISPQTFVSVSLCSTRAIPIYKNAPQTSILTRVVHDTGKYCVEGLFGSDSTLFGIRGLWNFEALPRTREDGCTTSSLGSINGNGIGGSSASSSSSSTSSSSSSAASGTKSFISAGAELYYSPISSVVGMSTGLRFATLPLASTTTTIPSSPLSSLTSPSSSSSAIPSSVPIPYTLTLTLAPLTGSFSTTYSILASENLALSSRFGFNAYSWESEMVAGCEIWRRNKKRRREREAGDLDWARKKLGLPLLHPELNDDDHDGGDEDSGANRLARQRYNSSAPNDSVVKVRMDQSCNVRVLWEGKFKELLVSAGVSLGPMSARGMLDPRSGAAA